MLSVFELLLLVLVGNWQLPEADTEAFEKQDSEENSEYEALFPFGRYLDIRRGGKTFALSLIIVTSIDLDSVRSLRTAATTVLSGFAMAVLFREIMMVVEIQISEMK